MAEKMTRHNGIAIRAFRTQQGRKPSEFAKAVDMSYAHLDNLENERKEASIEALYRIATELGVPPTALVRDPAFVVPRDSLRAAS